MRLPVALVSLVVLLLAGGLVTGAAHAQPAVAAPPPTGEPTYHSPMRQQCEGELKKDKDWYAILKEQCYAAVQNDASLYATTNHRHVLMAYAAFWLLTVGFVVHLWRRQQALKGEVIRLEQELGRALREDPARGATP